MKVKQMTVYVCDFCKKKRYRKNAMEKHEKHCTMNPNRECRMCGEMDLEQVPMERLLALLPNKGDFRGQLVGFPIIESGDLRAAVTDALPMLREETGGCPMCMFSALRQAGLLPWLDDAEFDFKKELASAWKEINNRELVNVS